MGASSSRASSADVRSWARMVAVTRTTSWRSTSASASATGSDSAFLYLPQISTQTRGSFLYLSRMQSLLEPPEL